MKSLEKEILKYVNKKYSNLVKFIRVKAISLRI